MLTSLQAGSAFLKLWGWQLSSTYERCISCRKSSVMNEDDDDDDDEQAHNLSSHGNPSNGFFYSVGHVSVVEGGVL